MKTTATSARLEKMDIEIIRLRDEAHKTFSNKITEHSLHLSSIDDALYKTQSSIVSLEREREAHALRLGKIENDHMHTTKFVESISKSLDNLVVEFKAGIDNVVGEISKLKEANTKWDTISKMISPILYVIFGGIVAYLFKYLG